MDFFSGFRLLLNPREVWRGWETSPFSIEFGGMHAKFAFFGSERLRLRRKMNSSGQATARKIRRFSGCCSSSSAH